MRRKIAVGLVALAIAGCSALAIVVYRLKADPERPESGEGAAWIIGPPADELERAADRRLREALRTLRPGTPPAADRLRDAHARLQAAGALYRRSLRASPLRASALLRLAAVRWELEWPPSATEREAAIEMVIQAARLEPESVALQLRAGELLLHMRDERKAADHLRRALALAPEETPEAVRVLRDQGHSAMETLELLDRSPQLLVAMHDAFLEEGLGGEYLRILEQAWPFSTAELFRVYGDLCLDRGLGERLRDRMRGAPRPDVRLEAERLLQRSAAHRSLGQLSEALRDAREARYLLPGDPRVVEHLGAVALLADDPELALATFREAMRSAAGGGAAASTRARLYRWLGETHEALDRPDLAYDAYRRALQLDPTEREALRRVGEMRAATGLTDRR